MKGEVWEGPRLNELGPNPDSLAGIPHRIYADARSFDVRDDLTIVRRDTTCHPLLNRQTLGAEIFGICRPPDGSGAHGWWPLAGPCEYRSDTQFWLLVRIDSGTEEVIAVTPVHSLHVSIAPVRHGFLVATGTGLYRWAGAGFSELVEIDLDGQLPRAGNLEA